MSLFKDKTLMITGGTGSFGNAVLNRHPLLRWIFADSWELVWRSRRWKGAQSCFCLFYGGSFHSAFG